MNFSNCSWFGGSKLHWVVGGFSWNSKDPKIWPHTLSTQETGKLLSTCLNTNWHKLCQDRSAQTQSNNLGVRSRAFWCFQELVANLLPLSSVSSSWVWLCVLLNRKTVQNHCLIQFKKFWNYIGKKARKSLLSFSEFLLRNTPT